MGHDFLMPGERNDCTVTSGGKAAGGLLQFGAGLVMVLIGVPLVVLTALQQEWLLLAMASSSSLVGALSLTGWADRRARPS